MKIKGQWAKSKIKKEIVNNRVLCRLIKANNWELGLSSSANNK